MENIILSKLFQFSFWQTMKCNICVNVSRINLRHRDAIIPKFYSKRIKISCHCVFTSGITCRMSRAYFSLYAVYCHNLSWFSFEHMRNDCFWVSHWAVIVYSCDILMIWKIRFNWWCLFSYPRIFNYNINEFLLTL